ncbi:MAG: branched-chain amino acid transporter substrate-binding protein [Actinomycetia bacterium]|nr:branched-chain amino acid transporter substrate-binding protein [Actinomycetes bacterium]
MNLRSGKWTKLLVPLTALSLLAVACGGNGSDGTAATDSTTKGGDNAGKAPASAPGFDGTTITLGVITPQTGIAAVIGKPLTNGNQVYFDHLNAAGGIAGKYKVQLKIVDSQYSPPTGVQQYNATKGSVAAYVQILGTGVVNAILPQLKTDNIVAGPASLDSFWVPEQQLMALGAPYQVQAINAMDWWVNQQKHAGSKICVMYQDDPYGKAGLEGVEFAGKEMGFTVAKKVTFAVTDTEFGAQVNQLKASSCELVYLVGLPSATGGIMGAAEQTGFTPQWIGQSPTWIGLLSGNTYMQQHFLVVNEGPEWGDTTSEGMTQMIDDITKYDKQGQKPDIYFAFGYAQAWSMAQILEKAVANGDLSHDGIIAAMNGVGTLKTGGLLGDYAYGAPKDRTPPRAGRMFKVDPAVPGGLKALTPAEFTSDAAKKFTFAF